MLLLSLAACAPTPGKTTASSSALPTVTVTQPAVVSQPATSTPTSNMSVSPMVATTLPAQETTPIDVVTLVAKVKPSVVAIHDQVDVPTFGGLSTQAAAGSGWLIDANGIIVTNDHVISGATNVMITLDDGRIFPAKSVNSDPVNDLAIIRIDATGLPALKLGDSGALQLGMQVIAIGNALDEGIRVTGGMVSNLGTSITLSATQTLYDLVETDASINPGNSG
ncbi:MAG: trypsin-like peptidase domain-containing protein, partial [Dehalococcoidales bacterium]|nr:trypsin-like peptidase domain-containing protein [Dehalococcoidales bacterium]